MSSMKQLELYANSISPENARKSGHALSLIIHKLSKYNDHTTVQSFIPAILKNLLFDNVQNQLKAIKCIRLIIYLFHTNNIEWSPGYNLMYHILMSLKQSNSKLVTQKLASLLQMFVKSSYKSIPILFKLNGFKLLVEKVIDLLCGKKKDSFYDIDVKELMNFFAFLFSQKQVKIYRYLKDFEVELYLFIDLWKNKSQTNIRLFKRHFKNNSRKHCECDILLPIGNVVSAFINFMANVNIQFRSRKKKMYTSNTLYIQHIINMNLPQLIHQYLLLTTDCPLKCHLKDILVHIQTSCIQFLDTFCTAMSFERESFQYTKFLNFDYLSLLKATKDVFDDHMHDQLLSITGAELKCDHQECKMDRYCAKKQEEITDAVKYRMQQLLSYVCSSNSNKRLKCIDLLLRYENGKLMNTIIKYQCNTKRRFELIIIIMKFGTIKQFKKLFTDQLRTIQSIPGLYSNVMDMTRIRCEMDDWPKLIKWKKYKNKCCELCAHIVSFIQIRKSIDCILSNKLYNLVILELFEFFGMYDEDKLYLFVQKRKTLKLNFKGILCAYNGCKRKNNEVIKIKLCSGCRLVYYCCSNHQKKDWKYGGHRILCQIMQCNDSILFSPLMRLLAGLKMI